MTVHDRYEGFQSIMKAYAENGCHFTVLLTIAEEKCREENPEYQIDFIEAVRMCMNKTTYGKPILDKNFYVNDALEILFYLTGYKWTRSDKLPFLPKINSNQWTECNWYNESTKREHFTRRSINSLIDSQTVKHGKIRYYYVYTCVS